MSSRLYLAITVLVGVVVVLSTVYGVWQFETYVYPPGCTLRAHPRLRGLALGLQRAPADPPALERVRGRGILRSSR